MEGYPKLERPNGIESRKENTPSVDEVEYVFESLLGENEFKEIRKLED